MSWHFNLGVCNTCCTQPTSAEWLNAQLVSSWTFLTWWGVFSLLFVLKVMVLHFVSDCHKVRLALIIILLSKCCSGDFSTILYISWRFLQVSFSELFVVYAWKFLFIRDWAEVVCYKGGQPFCNLVYYPLCVATLYCWRVVIQSHVYCSLYSCLLSSLSPVETVKFIV